MPQLKTVPHVPSFQYERAFVRNLGVCSEKEQQRLNQATLAIAGCGGVGSFHAMECARLGIGGFHLADFDSYGLENFNRQLGARISTLEKPKVKVTERDVLDINPLARIQTYPQGITSENMDSFLDNVDIAIDGLDYFNFTMRIAFFAACERKNIPVITAGPLGMSCAMILFGPGSMSYRRYFGFKDTDKDLELGVKLLLGLAPQALQRSYMDYSRVNLKEHYGPSCIVGVSLCASYTAATVFKLLLRPKKVRFAPWYHQVDAYTHKSTQKRLRGGFHHPLQRIKYVIARRRFRKIGDQS